MTQPVAAWNDGGIYESYIGRWSRRVAVPFLHWLDIAPHAAWLDFGCGTGALTQTILAETSPRLVTGCDRSEAYVGFARAQTPDPRATFVACELPDLPATDGGFDVVTAGLVLNFVPSALDALRAFARRAKAGGTVAGYVWDYADGMQLLRVFWETAIALEPEAGALHQGERFPICRPGALRAAFAEAGLHKVEDRAIEIETVFRDFDDYWNPFLGGQGPAPSYVASLSASQREALRDCLRERLPVAADGTISLRARAWAARGIVP